MIVFGKFEEYGGRGIVNYNRTWINQVLCLGDISYEEKQTLYRHIA